MEFETILLGKEIINGTTNSSNIHLLISKNIKKQLVKHNNKLYYLFKLNVDNYTIELKQINKKACIGKSVKNIPNNTTKSSTSFITNTTTSYFSLGSRSGTYLNSGPTSGGYQFRKDDEGFESEGEGEDFSLNSSEESSSSSVLTNRLFELKNIFTDSANSSGTDSDDIHDKINVNIKNIVNYEIYKFSDIIFLHNDAKYPKVLVLIVKINSSNLQINAPLEAILLQFSNYENIKIIFKYYNELKNKNKYNNKLNKQLNYSINNNNFSLLEQVDLDGVTHIEITSNHSASQPSNEIIESIDYRPSCIISINTPDLGNIETIPLGKVSISSNSNQNNSSNTKQIDAIIYTETEPNPPTRPERRKKKQTSSPQFLETSNQNELKSKKEQSQERIIRGQFVKINVSDQQLKDQQPKNNINTVDKSSIKSDDVTTAPSNSDEIQFNKRLYSSDHKIQTKSGGKFVKNDKASQHRSRRPDKPDTANSKINGSNEYKFERNGPLVKSLDLRSYHRDRSVPDGNSRYYKNIRPVNYSNVDYNKIKYRSRSKSPPLRRMPMMSYVPVQDYTNTNGGNSISNKFFNKLKDLKNDLKLKKNPLDLASQPTSQFYTDLDSNYRSLHISKSTPNLKSALIKSKHHSYFNNNHEELSEPKKVTFSAYATVQVVD